ncbi:DNA-dependent ATPase mgs1 [Polyrhizophydium stewartii]|uniref:DNA-dependent ATPase mgs1 n=1 Tax=Polyrhizophydium stewartii TaxID=2732419 RepID=A0ABR4N3P9_9FUNG
MTEESAAGSITAGQPTAPPSTDQHARDAAVAAPPGFVCCPVCERHVRESDINEHLDAGCPDEASRIASLPMPVPTALPAALPAASLADGARTRGHTQTRLSFGPRTPKRLRPDGPSGGADVVTSPPAHPLQGRPLQAAAASRADPAPKAAVHQPLAELARPAVLDDFLGHGALVGEASLLRQLIESKRVPCMILWGPPGSGKTTLARIIARAVGTNFIEMSATVHTVADRPIFFLDEIHRFTKAQQDIFLPPVERGDFTFIAATTENPSFRVNAALLSRCRVFVLGAHEPASVVAILKRAAAIKLEAVGIAAEPAGSSAQGGGNGSHPSDGSSAFEQLADSSLSGADMPRPTGAEAQDQTASARDTPAVAVPGEAIEFLAQMCDGDARAAINGLEMAMDAALQTHSREVSVALVREALQKSHLLYDRQGEEHYNVISALHKSMRGSDANAALYWLGRMIYAGEDPMYVARRLVRFASEDVGLADSAALPLAMAAMQACQAIGMPECDAILAHCVTYLARAPKSVETYKAIKRVKETIQSTVAYPVPLHIRNAPTALMQGLGYGHGYKYNPDFDGPVDQTYLPPELQGIGFFESSQLQTK